MNPRIRPLGFLAPLLMATVMATLAFAHPMGNFSVSHYSRIEPARDGAAIRYVLDLAEIPTFQLLQQWQLDATSPQAELERHAAEQARQWSGNLKIELDGRAVKPRFERATLVLDKGAGGMAIMRVIAELKVAGAPGQLHFEDTNFPDRAGWKEIVVIPSQDAIIDRATPIGSDRSHELTAYPQDPLLAPPQDLSATVAWRAAPIPTATATATLPATPAAPLAEPPETPPAPAASEPPAAPAAASALQPNQAAPGMVVRGDYLSKLLHRGDIGWGMMLAGMVVAFGLGSVHALSPGHGKTIVAAYLVGARGTARHALFLGGMVTFTHTISVFFLGLVTLFLSRYVLPEKIFPVLGAISGGSIVWIGATLLYKRIRVAFFGSGVHFEPHSHDHDHDHDHDHGHTHTHDHGGLAHDHGDGHVHSHVPEGEISMGSLVALGASGGLVPCPSALVLLLSSVALGRVGLGLTLLVAFSMGLAVVLSGIGIVVLYAKNLLPDSKNKTRNAVFRYLPVASAAVIVCAGILMTGVALGVIRPIAGV
jgi:ABC-type nickel/cobalt efflux system permease component RcnA